MKVSPNGVKGVDSYVGFTTLDGKSVSVKVSSIDSLREGAREDETLVVTKSCAYKVRGKKEEIEAYLEEKGLAYFGYSARK